MPFITWAMHGRKVATPCRLKLNDHPMGVRSGQSWRVCVDATQGTNAYEFKQITLLVVDEHGEGFPVAWCIANREDRVLLIAFFTSIRTKCGMVHPLWFMSDMADQYHLAWVSVFDDSPQKLSATGMLTGHGGGLAAACQGVERQAAEGPFRRAGCRQVHHLNWQGKYNNIQ